MAHYPDLTPYEYSELVPGGINVGWLSKGHAFPRGSVPHRFLRGLRRLAESPVNSFRGYHVCEFCTPPDDLDKLGGNCDDAWTMPRRCNGEIRILGRAGVTYIAPALIWHYVVEHQYLPPQEFIDAVLASAEGDRNL